MIFLQPNVLERTKLLVSNCKFAIWLLTNNFYDLHNSTLLRKFADISSHFVFPAPNMEQSMYESSRPVFQGQRKPSARIAHTEARTTRFLVSSCYVILLFYERMTPFFLISGAYRLAKSRKRKESDENERSLCLWEIENSISWRYIISIVFSSIFIFHLFFSSICPISYNAIM